MQSGRVRQAIAEVQLSSITKALDIHTLHQDLKGHREQPRKTDELARLKARDSSKSIQSKLACDVSVSKRGSHLNKKRSNISSLRLTRPAEQTNDQQRSSHYIASNDSGQLLELVAVIPQPDRSCLSNSTSCDKQQCNARDNNLKAPPYQKTAANSCLLTLKYQLTTLRHNIISVESISATARSVMNFDHNRL
jgi:hypothetical protein